MITKPEFNYKEGNEYSYKRWGDEYFKLQKFKENIRKATLTFHLLAYQRHSEKLWQIPASKSELFVIRLLQWKRDDYPTFDLLKHIRNYGSKKKTTRKILFKQITKMLKTY